MNNIAEGFERKSDPDFARFLDIAKDSNGEVRSMLYLAEDRSYLVAQEAVQMRPQSEQLSRAIESLAKHLRR
jgi:four helix bundle protein